MVMITKLMSDMDKERRGVWFDYELGIRLRIARFNNSDYLSALRKLLEPHQSKIRRGMMSAEEVDKIAVAAVARHILTDWSGIDDEEGKPLTYSVSKAEEYLADAKLHDLYTFVLEKSRDAAAFRREDTEEAKGN